MPRDIPIIFSAPMMAALLSHRKTMTRRLAWLPPRDPASGRIKDSYQRPTSWQNVEPGDRLWVRETHWRWGQWRKDGKTKTGRQRWRFSAVDRSPEGAPFIPVLFSEPPGPHPAREELGFHCRPSIFLPREHSRLTLIVKAVKIEPVRSISLQDVLAEGCEVRQFWLFGAEGKERQRIGAVVFGNLWSGLHGRASWDANPEVVALTFRVVHSNIDEMEEQAA